MRATRILSPRRPAMNPNRLDLIVDLIAYIFVAALVAFMVFAIYR